MKRRAEHHDVVVVGGGPVGCATAIAFARRNARVLVLESNPDAHRRLAGEWIHTAGVQALGALGVDLTAIPHSVGRGFVVFPDDHGSAIRLPYTGGSTALACDHRSLVEALRRELARYPTISVLRDVKATVIREHHVGFVDRRTSAERAVRAGLVVGADGRNSAVAKAQGLDLDRISLSHTLGVLLDDVELPYEGFGHVLLGGPGPVLMYRLDERRLRVCLDVPLPVRRRLRGPGAISAAFGPVFPEHLREPLRHAIDLGRTQWAANGYRGRRTFGCGGLALAGDAAGFHHPMTASGLTLGFLDAVSLASTGTVQRYSSLRARQSRVPEMLAVALYEMFSGDDATNALLRAAVYDMWRRSPRECARTMRLLAVESTSRVDFDAAFVRCLLITVRGLARNLSGSGPALPPGALHRLTGWLRWLAGNSLLGIPSSIPVRRTA